MKSKDRILTALQHKEADRIPFDLGGTVDTGIHVAAYRNLLEYLGMDGQRNVKTGEFIMQLATVDEDIAHTLSIDTRAVLLSTAADLYYLNMRIEGNYELMWDPFGVKYLKPIPDGLYFDPKTAPLSGSVTLEDIESFDWPDLAQPRLIQALRNEAEKYAQDDRAIVLAAPDAGILERASWLRGFSDFLISLAKDPKATCYLLDIITDMHIKYWDAALDAVGEIVQVVVEADDLGMQDRSLISPDWYRKYIKPCHKRLFSFIKAKAPKVRIFFHSCGAIYELIPDLIETGIDILNPIQVNAVGMDTKQLKKDFGDSLTFWGGGVDTQEILPKGSTSDVKDEVKRRIDDLAPGGGFIFAAVHNIQPDVPPQNIMAMWESLEQYGKYS